VFGANSNLRVSKDPDSLPPSGDQQAPAMAYNWSAGNVLVAWHDHGHYDEGDVDYWGVWGRIWAPTWPVHLPLGLKAN
jgi:hypothetical protein